jgi:hypothetical protein
MKWLIMAIMVARVIASGGANDDRSILTPPASYGPFLSGRRNLRQQNEDEADGLLMGHDFLEGIRGIIGVDPNVPPNEVQYKPFVGSFSTIANEEGLPENVSYCMTDNACGHWDAYSRSDVPLTDLSCNSFCYIPASTRRYTKSNRYSTDNPPPAYLNCGWETCG